MISDVVDSVPPDKPAVAVSVTTAGASRPAVIFNVPPLTTTLPLSVFTALSTSAPLPVLVNEAAPLITPSKVDEAPPVPTVMGLPTLIVPTPESPPMETLPPVTLTVPVDQIF